MEDFATMAEGGREERIIGIWMSDKKFQKLRWPDLVAACRAHHFHVVRLDLDKPLEDQGNLAVFIHKLTDIIAAADQGDSKSQEVIDRVKQYISNHPNMLVVDPLDNVRILLDRCRYYSLIENHPRLKNHNIFTPTFCEFTTSMSLENSAALLRQRDVTFPLVCKPNLAHGSKSAHSMCVIFNQQGLVHCKPPCVVQSFINHNAVLYKVFVVGNSYHIVERPSLKNFYACDDKEPIFFYSGEVCKSDSQSTLSILDPHDIENVEHKRTQLDLKRVEVTIKTLQEELQMALFGIDIVVDNMTDKYAIIDVNVYPGYEGYPNFFDNLITSVDSLLNVHNLKCSGLMLSKLSDMTLDENNENFYECCKDCYKNVSNCNVIKDKEIPLNVDSYNCKNILKNINSINNYDN